MRPRLDGIGETLMASRDASRGQATFENQIQPAQMDHDGLVRVRTSSMLRREGIHGQLMGLPEQHDVVELRADHLGEHAPALRRGVEVAFVDHGIADRHQ